MDVIHSDCSFVDDFSQNHFNMKLHYGFLFFDYLFKFILQLTVKKVAALAAAKASEKLTQITVEKSISTTAK
ncbi:hypothetical protein CJ260_01790 [Megasphaera sp. ASD88]|nr:hypothetical protein CJ260_01790 [Megasphaera sp. ASD88]